MDGVSNRQMQARKIHLADFQEELGLRKKTRETCPVGKLRSSYKSFIKGDKTLKQQGNAEGTHFTAGKPWRTISNSTKISNEVMG